MPIYDDIRETLQKKLEDTTGLPTFFAQNTPEDLPPDGDYMQDRLFITSRRPATRGPNPQMRYQGIYRITVCVPKRTGTGNALRYAELISAAFDGSTNIVGPNKTISVEYCETAQDFESDTHYCLPLDVAWYIYDV